jgi:hypothetical protein
MSPLRLWLIGWQGAIDNLEPRALVHRAKAYHQLTPDQADVILEAYDAAMDFMINVSPTVKPGIPSPDVGHA